MVKRKVRKRVEFEAKDLVTMVKKGSSAQEIKERFGFKTSTQIRNAYLNGLIKLGQVPDIPRGRGRAKMINEVTIGKRGTISLKSDMVIGQFAYKVGDRFSVRKRKDNLILQKL